MGAAKYLERGATLVALLFLSLFILPGESFSQGSTGGSVGSRSSDYRTDVALGSKPGSSTWNKFGYNDDIDVGTEVMASFGGTYTPLTNATTLTFNSTTNADVNGGTGVHGVVVYGVDSNWNERTEVVFLSGITNVVTTSLWRGVSRMSNFRCGDATKNVGTIDCIATTGGAIQAQIPPGAGTSQQMIYFVPASSQSLVTFLLFKATKPTGGQVPIVTFKVWVMSDVANSKYEVFRYVMDTSVELHLSVPLPEPLVIGERSAVWMEVGTDKDNTVASGRLSLIQHSN